MTYVGRDDAGAEPGVDSISSFPEAVKWLLLTRANPSYATLPAKYVTWFREWVKTKSSSLRDYAMQKSRWGDVFREQDLITIYIGGLKPHARYEMRESLSRTEKRKFQQIHEQAKSPGDTFREQKRKLGKIKTNFKPKEKLIAGLPL